MTTRLSVAATIFAFAVVSCAVYEKKQPVEGDKAIVAAYVNAWNQRDTVALDTLLAPEGIHEDIAQNFRGRGPKQVIAFMRGLIAAEPDFKWTIANSFEEGRVVALEWTWASSYSGKDPGGRQVTNRRISGRGTSIAEVEDGKIKRFTDYYDIASFFR